MSISEISQTLLARVGQVNAPRDVTGIAQLPDGLRKMYKVFDGFPDGVYDPSSGIRIWTASEVAESAGNGPLEFADLLIGSDIFSFDETRQGEITDSKGKVVAASIEEFLLNIVTGKHDFL